MPETIVSNTTPIISLSLIGHLDLLKSLYGEILIPPAVQQEVLRGERRAGATELAAAPWIRVASLSEPNRADLLADLDRGEAEAIALAQEIEADLLIVDERLARRYARRLGMRLTGTVGILIRARQERLLPSILPLIQQLQQNGFWLTDAVVEQALRLAGER